MDFVDGEGEGGLTEREELVDEGSESAPQGTLDQTNIATVNDLRHRQVWTNRTLQLTTAQTRKVETYMLGSSTHLTTARTCEEEGEAEKGRGCK